MPFIRVLHVPCVPNLKLVGSNICIEADILHAIERLQITSENIIPVSFKRKLVFIGHYLEDLVNKQKIFNWPSFLKLTNPFYKNIRINKTDINDEIDIMSEQLFTDSLLTMSNVC